jgi:AcrR family transcriptional regulator
VARPKTYDDRLRQTLLATAAEVIAARGADELALRPLAERAGTSTNAVYSLFGSKAGLVAAVVAEAAASFTAAQRDVPATDDPLGDLAGLGRAYRDWALAHPALYAVMFGDRVRVDEALGASYDGSMEPLLAAVARAMDAGLLRRGDQLLVATSIWAGIHGLVSLEIADRLACDPRAGDVVEEHLNAVVAYWLADPTLLSKRRR